MRLNIDLRAYLDERYPGRFELNDRGILIGACLFHRDGRRPNLGVFANGSFRCLSCGARGNIVKLVQHIENLPTYADAAEWLSYHYGIGEEDEEEAPIELTLDIDCADNLCETDKWRPPSDEILAAYRWRHPYILSRGISEIWLRRFEVGFDKRTQTVTFPWRDRKGRLVTVKHRRIDSKRFFYWPRVPRGMKNSLLYGLHHIARRRDSIVYITEAEIDCISLWQSGRPSVALGGAYMSKEQARELALAGVALAVLACDRDEAGERAHEVVRERLRPYGIECVRAIWPPGFEGKDANDALLAGRLDELGIESTGLSLGGAA